jgi:hypothetical protein
MSGTTSLSELPSAPQSQPAQNIQMDINAKIDNPMREIINERSADPSVVQKDFNSIVSGIQQASAAGTTALPSRDIPQTQTALTQDEQTQPNFVPNQIEKDYIGSVANNDEILRKQQLEQNKTESVSYIYEQLQTPLLVSFLYFIFQLPVLKATLFKFVPVLFKSDGNPNLKGYVFQSIIFGGLYYTMNSVLAYVGN